MPISWEAYLFTQSVFIGCLLHARLCVQLLPCCSAFVLKIGGGERAGKKKKKKKVDFL